MPETGQSRERLLERVAALEDEIARLRAAVAPPAEPGDAWFQSGEHFRALVETLNEGLVVADADDLIVFANGRAAELFGVTTAEVVGRRVPDFVVPDDRPLYEQNLARRRQGETSRYEVAFQRPDDRPLAAIVSGRPLLDEAGGFTGSFAVLTDITEYRHAEEALRESEARLRNIVEHSSNLFYAHTTEHVLTYVSPQSATFFACEPEEAMVQWTELVTDHPQNEKGYEHTVRAIRTGKRQPPYELELRRRDGTTLWVEVHETPVVEDGRVTAIVGALRDVTEQRRMEHLLRIVLDLGLALGAAQTRPEAYRKTIEAALQVDEVDGAGLYVLDQDTGELVLVCHEGLSDAFTEMVARVPATDPRHRIIAEVPAGHVTSSSDGTKAEGLLTVAVFPIRREGRLLGALNLGSRTVDMFPPTGAGALETLASQLGPVLSRFEAQDSLRKSEATLRGLVGAAPAGIGLVRDRVFVWVNEHMTRLTGYSAEELLGESARIIYPDDAEFRRVGELKYEKIERTGSGTLETRWQRKDGGLIDVMLSSAALDRSNLSAGVVFTAWDITERMRAEEERRRLEAQVQHAQKLESLGMLAGGIAHDFNNILHAILGNANLAGQSLPGGDPARRHLEEIEHAAARAGELCHQMLAYSGRGSFVIEGIHLGYLVREIATMLLASLAKKTTLQIEAAEELPVIEADATQMRQVVINLITNADEAIGDAVGTVHVRIFAEFPDAKRISAELAGERLPEGTYVVLEVADTGCGMSAETRERIFEPFFTTKFAGRGLGLAAVQGIVRGHEGAIRVASEEGQGTTVTVLFPATTAVAVKATEPAVVAPTYKAEGAVLLADDEPEVLNLGRTMLEMAGFEVVAVGDGGRAVEVFRDRPGDFVCAVIDLTMPEMDGDEVFHALRRIRPDLPVVLCSGFSEQELRSRFGDDAPSAFLQKPFTGLALQQALARLL